MYNGEITVEDLINGRVDIDKVDYDKFKKVYRRAVVMYQNDEEILKVLNSLNDKVKKRRITDYSANTSTGDFSSSNDTKEKDTEKENDSNNNKQVNDSNNPDDVIEYIPGTKIPKPRDRGLYESDLDYVKYLKEYYEEIFKKLLEAKENEKNQNNVEPLKIEDQQKEKDELLGIEDQQKGKDEPLGIEDQQKGKVEPLGIEDQQKIDKPQVKRGLHEIFADLEKDLKIDAKTGQRYMASKCSVFKGFKDKVTTGNALYNVVGVVNGVLMAGATTITKVINKITYTKEQRANMATLKERIYNLPIEDVETIEKEYRSSRMNAMSRTSALNVLLQERINDYYMDNVNKMNNHIEERYNELFIIYSKVREINVKLSQNNLTDDERIVLESCKNDILQDCASKVKDVRDTYTDANNLLSGGLRGFEEDVRATNSNMSKMGMRFAKRYGNDQELSLKLADIEKRENEAIAYNDNEKALMAFVDMEKAYSEETKIKKTMFGEVSVGKTYYSPFAERLNYAQDPFIRDLISTVTVVTAGLSAVEAYKTHVVDANKVINNQQSQASQVNAANDSTMQFVNQTGSDIAGHRTVFGDGMKASAMNDTNNITNTLERHALDSSNWKLNSDTYHNLDNSAHDFFNSTFDQTSTSLNDITVKLSTGQMNQAEALQQIANISNQTNQAFVKTCNDCIDVFQQYANNHPQFDLHSVTEAVSYASSHPDVITKMNQGMVDVTNMGDTLTTLTATHIQALNSLPSDMKTTLLQSASSCILASNVAKTMTNNSKRGKYGNSITELVDSIRLEDIDLTDENGKTK